MDSSALPSTDDTTSTSDKENTSIADYAPPSVWDELLSSWSDIDNENDSDSDLIEACQAVETASSTPDPRSNSTYSALGKRKHASQSSNEDQHQAPSSTVKPANQWNCGQRCMKKCQSRLFLDEDLKAIQSAFHSLDWSSKRCFIKDAVRKLQLRKQDKKREGRKQNSYLYSLKLQNGISITVCKKFFLKAVGLKSHNDKIIRNTLKDIHIDGQNVPVSFMDKRGKQKNSQKINTDKIIRHIESYGPDQPHYRRQHAPKRRYLPSDITVKRMHEDYKFLHSNDVSYPSFFRIFKSLNISMTVLGNEECDICVIMFNHRKNCDCVNSCEFFTNFIRHKRRYKAAREMYQIDCRQASDPNEVKVSVDLQKVIMLPRMEQYKVGIFTRRLTVYNETFASLGAKGKDLTVLWHEAISGRKDEDITSTYFKFLCSQRDTRAVLFWLDNCTSQNKNWTLFSMFVFYVNEMITQIESITLKFFEKNHTFMSADSVHAKIEKRMKKKGCVYDFKDFQNCVEDTGCKTIIMRACDFSKWEAGQSSYKLNKLEQRPMLADMVEVKFVRGKECLFYKTNFKDKFNELDFLKSSFDFSKPAPLKKDRGIEEEKKQGIVKSLVPLMPIDRREFWQNISIS